MNNWTISADFVMVYVVHWKNTNFFYFILETPAHTAVGCNDNTFNVFSLMEIILLR